MTSRLRQKGEHLTTFAAVWDALGGNQGLQNLTGRAKQSVSDWKMRSRFPAEFFDLMTERLRLQNRTASPDLWSQARGRHVVDPITNEVVRMGGKER